jgi:phospholipid N-methyltransferase
MLHFLKQTITNFKTTGAIAPIRKKAARHMVANHLYQIAMADIVVEFGPGTGVITDGIRGFLHRDAMLILVEANKEFADKLKVKYRNDKRITVINCYAQDLNKDIFVDGTAAVVVNSIPMSLMSEESRHDVYNEAYRLLCNDGLLMQYQYTTRPTKKIMQEIFVRPCHTQFTWSNIIPTYFMSIKK